MGHDIPFERVNLMNSVSVDRDHIYEPLSLEGLC